MFVGQFCMNMYLATMMAHRAPHAAFTLRANAPRSTAAMILITRCGNITGTRATTTGSRTGTIAHSPLISRSVARVGRLSLNPEYVG